MSKSNVTRNDLVKFMVNSVAMPSYGTNLYIHVHTADPGLSGASSTNEATFTGYARVTKLRDNTDWVICDPDGTPNPSGTAFKNLTEITFPECTGVADDEDITYGSICTNAGQILYKAALTATVNVQNQHTLRFPIGTLIFKEG